MTTKADRKRALEFFVCTSSVRVNFPDGAYPALDPEHIPEHCIVVFCTPDAPPKSLPYRMKRGGTYKVTNWSNRGKRAARDLMVNIRDAWVARGHWELHSPCRLS